MNIVKVKRRKINILVPLFVIIVITNVVVSLFIGSLNVQLTCEIQQMKEHIIELKEENSQLAIDIASLEGKDRVYDIASAYGLDQNEKNIVYAGSISSD